MNSKHQFSNNGTPSWWVSLIPVITLVGLMALVIRFFGQDALAGGSQVALITSMGIAIAIAMMGYGCTWEKLAEAINDNIRSIGTAILILLMIGTISGSWMVSGIVPTFICYGLKFISPSIFLFAVCLICALVSLVTGSSWTTVATIGVAMIAIGNALGSLMAGILALIIQPDIVAWIGGDTALTFESAFKGIVTTYFGDTGIDCGYAGMNDLIATHGMNGMLSTIFLIICAASFGGVFKGSGMIHSITERFIRSVRSRTGLVASTVGTGIFCNMTMGDQYLSIILISSLFKKLYTDLGYEGRLLSRSTEDSATVTSVLIPWNSCGMTQSTVLHVPTVEYLPYCFFNILSPCMSIFVAALGYKIYRILPHRSVEK